MLKYQSVLFDVNVCLYLMVGCSRADFRGPGYLERLVYLCLRHIPRVLLIRLVPVIPRVFFFFLRQLDQSYEVKGNLFFGAMWALKDSS